MRGKESAAVERVFAIELNSRSNVKDVTAPGGTQRVVIEGTIGTLQHAVFVDDAVLELVGSGGILRVDLSREDLASSPENPRGGGRR